MKQHRFILNKLILIISLLLITNFSLIAQIKILLNDKAQELLKSKPVKNEFSFAVMGDAHLNDYFIDERILPNILDEINNTYNKPEFIIMLGDIAENGNYYQYNQIYNYISDWMDTTGIPFFILPGNHDFDNFSAFLNYISFIDNDLDYYFDYGIYRFVLINNVNSVNSSNYNVKPNQLDSIDSWLLNAPAGKKFSFAHIPLVRDFYSSGLDNQGFAQLLDILESREVSAFFNGHIHDYYRVLNNNIYHINTGGSGASTLGTYFPPFSYNSHHWLLINVDECSGVYSEMYRYPQGRDSIAQLYDFQISSQLIVNANIDSVSCSGISDGAISLSVTGGNSSGLYDFLWSNYNTASSIQSLQAGIYNVTITDSMGCYSTKSFKLNEPAELINSVVIIPDTNNNCVASIILNTYGGTLPYSYSWSEPNGGDNNLLSGLCENNYYVTVTDANNCIVENQIFVNNVYAGISNKLNNVDINVWPNPASDYLMIHLPEILDNFIDIKLYNNIGNLVLSNRINLNSSKIIKLNLPPLINGLYFLKIQSPDNKYVSAKILIN